MDRILETAEEPGMHCVSRDLDENGRPVGFLTPITNVTLHQDIQRSALSRPIFNIPPASPPPRPQAT